MKTTIDLPDALAEQAKRLAGQERTSLRELVIQGLRHEIERRSRAPTVDFVFPTAGGQGIVVDLAPGDAVAASYDLSR